jgi:hypothetical protein
VDGNDESGFFGDYVSDLAMVGFINGVMKGAQGLAGKVLESIAKRNLGGKAGLVLAEGAEGAAGTALEAEKARLLDGIWCEAGKRFGAFGVEYVAFQTFEYLKTAGTLLAKDVKDPLKKAWDHLTSPLALAHGAAFLLGAKGLHSVAGLITDPIAARFQDAAEKIQHSRKGAEQGSFELGER